MAEIEVGEERVEQGGSTEQQDPTAGAQRCDIQSVTPTCRELGIISVAVALAGRQNLLQW